MNRDLDLLWKDLVEKAYIKEENVILKELEVNSTGAVNILVVESTGKGAVVINEAYCTSNSNLAIDINRIHLPKFKLKEIVELLG